MTQVQQLVEGIDYIHAEVKRLLDINADMLEALRDVADECEYSMSSAMLERINAIVAKATGDAQ